MRRQFYIQLKAWSQSKDRKPLILSGVRQCGKTYLLEAFGANEFPQTHYFNFEQSPLLTEIFEPDLDPKRIVNELTLRTKTNINVETDFVIFDEIQACPKALTSLKYFQEDMPALALASAGSLLGVSLTPISYPVGKVNLLHLYPMSFIEFLEALRENQLAEFLINFKIDSRIPQIIHQQLWEFLKWYFIIGGLPEIVLKFSQQRDNLYEAFTSARIRQQELILMYYADMSKHAGNENTMHLARVWENIPQQLAQKQDGSAGKFKFKGVVPGIDRYRYLAGALDWLKAAGLTIQIPIVNKAQIPLKAFTQENRFKLYMFDVGILGALSRLEPQSILNYDYGSYKGYFAENFIAQEFFAAGHTDLYSWQIGRNEVEFLRTENSEILPIEVKSGWVTRARSLQAFVDRYQPPYRTIMSAKPFEISHDRLVHLYPLYLASRFPL